jgi:hypothetical protein
MPALMKNPPRGLWAGLLSVTFASGFAALALYLRIGPLSHHLPFEQWLSPSIGLDKVFSRNVSSCPGIVCIYHPYRAVRTSVVGYDITSVETSEYGLIANLVLAGKECHAYGTDRKDLIVEVTYETNTRWGNRVPMCAPTNAVPFS